MAKQEKPARASNVANATTMGAPFAAEVALHSVATLGAGATAAGLAGAGAATVYGVAKRRESPRRKARRDLRTAARTASGASTRRSSGSRAGGLLGGKSNSGRVAGAKRSSAAGKTAGVLGGSKRSGAPAGSAKRAGSTSTPKRAGAASGSGRNGSASRKSAGGTALGTKQAKSTGSGGSRAHGARSSRGLAGGAGRGGNRAPFGHGPRGSAARSRFGSAAGKGSGKSGGARLGGKGGGKSLLGKGSGKSAGGSGRSGGVLSRLKPGGKSNAGGGRRGGLFAGSGGRKPASNGNRRRTAAQHAAARKRASLPHKHNRQRWAGSVAGRTVAGSWRGFGRTLGKDRNSGLGPAAGRGLALLGRGSAGLVGTAIGALMFTPHLVRANHALGVAAARNVNVGRSALAGWLDPYSEHHQRRLEEQLNVPRRSGGTGNSTTGGSTMSNATAEHVEALIEQVRDAGVIDRESVTGVGAAAHAEAMGRLVHAVAEYAGANVEVLKEALPQLDGGESLNQQTHVIAGAAEAVREASTQFEAAHEDRLARQRDPESGEAAWDVSAVQN